MGTGDLSRAQSLRSSPPMAEPPMPAMMMFSGLGQSSEACAAMCAASLKCLAALTEKVSMLLLSIRLISSTLSRGDGDISGLTLLQDSFISGLALKAERKIICFNLGSEAESG